MYFFLCLELKKFLDICIFLRDKFVKGFLDLYWVEYLLEKIICFKGVVFS